MSIVEINHLWCTGVLIFGVLFFSFMLFLSWRLFHSRLPMQHVFQRHGVALASRCHLCHSEWNLWSICVTIIFMSMDLFGNLVWYFCFFSRFKELYIVVGRLHLSS